ncbi:MAG: DUF87 domain-containing protein, partial [Candidatus Yanofskybacteria bacterium]|nr:DUF87 domain-containing protein [Candidatus Yanofskybacteria bacterium]
MNLIFLISSSVGLVIVFIAGLVVLGSFKTKGRMQRALNMSLFLIKVPRETANKEGGQKPDKELIAIAEQMLSGFTNMHSKGWNKFLYGEPYLSMELAVHHVGEETHFYITVPKSSEAIVEKQVYGLYPTAEVTKTLDYNIFNPQGASVGTYFMYAQDPILPIKTYQKLESDPIGGILTAMSKLEAEGEGAAMQILIRPSHDSKQKSLASKVAREMQSGYQFKEAYQRAKHPPKPQKPDPNKPPESEKPKVITPADDEVIKAITAKSSKPIFDINLRLIASAFSQARAEQILGDFQSSFVQFSSPDLNNLKSVKLAGRSLQKLIYNFSFRLFDESQKMAMSTEEITSLYHFPIHSTSAPRVKFLKAKPAEPPSNLPEQGIIIGTSVFRGQEIAVRMTDEDRRRHMYVIGQTGTGKTTIMKAMVRQDIENGKGVCVIDPHGDFAE